MTNSNVTGSDNPAVLAGIIMIINPTAVAFELVEEKRKLKMKKKKRQN